MKNNFKRITFILVVVLLSMLSAGSVLAYHYNYQDNDYNGYDIPIYNSGYYYNTYSYGWSGWDYHRVNYNYHYPYNYDGYYTQYQSYWYGGPWMRGYAHRVVPGYVAYPWPGYYR